MGSSNSSQTTQSSALSNAAYNYGQTTTPSPEVYSAGTGTVGQAYSLSQAPFKIPVAPVAPFNATENAAFSGVNANVGAAQPSYNQGIGLQGQSVTGAAPAYAQDIGLQGRSVTGAVPLFGQASSFEQPGNNPFFAPEVAGIVPLLQNEFAEQASGATGGWTQTAGGVGADRIGVAQGELARQQGLSEGAILSQIYGQSEQQAQQAGLNLNTIGATQAGVEQQAGSNIGQAATQRGALTQQAGVNEGQLAGAESATQLAALQAQLSTGELQQAQTQAQLNAPYQNILQKIAWPYQTSQFGAGIEAGLGPVLGSTTTGSGTASGSNISGSYTQGTQTPSILSQLGGLGSAIGGIGSAAGAASGIFGSGGLLSGLLAFDKGGRVKGYADGGAVGGPMAAHALSQPRPIQVSPMQWAGERMAPGGTVWADMEPPGLAEQLEHLKRKYADGGDIGGAAGIPQFGLTSIPNMLKKPMPGAGGGIGMAEMPQTHPLSGPDPSAMRTQALGSLPKGPSDTPHLQMPGESGGSGHQPGPMDIAKAVGAPMQAFHQAQDAFGGSWQPGGSNFESPDVAGGPDTGGFAHGGAVGYDDGGEIDDTAYLGIPDSAATYIDATPPVPPPQADWSWGGGGHAGAMEAPRDSSGAGWGMRSRHVPELPPDMSGSPFNAAGVAGMVGTPSGHIQTHLPPVMDAQPFNAAGVSGLAGTPSGPAPAAPSPMAPPGNINMPERQPYGPEMLLPRGQQVPYLSETAKSPVESSPQFGAGNSPVNYVPETAEQTGNPLAAPTAPSVGTPTVAGTKGARGVKGSWFGSHKGAYDWQDNYEPSGHPTASGIAPSTPGIALPSRSTLGHLFKVTGPDGKSIVVPQIDVGPGAKGRGVDISAAAAEKMGYTPKDFPTDGRFTVEPADNHGDEASTSPSLDQGLGKQPTAQNGAKVPNGVLQDAAYLVSQGGDRHALQQFMARNGYPMDGAWCGEFAAAVVHAAGGQPPNGAEVATNWLRYGKPVDGHQAQPGDVAVNTRGHPIGATGGHVGFVGAVNPDRGTFTLVGGNQGGAHEVSLDGYQFRRGDASVGGANVPSSPVEAQAGRGAAATPMEPRGLQVAQAGPMARPQQGNPITRFGDALGNFAARINPDWGMKNLQLERMQMTQPLYRQDVQQQLQELGVNRSGTTQEDLDHLDSAVKAIGGHDQDDVKASAKAPASQPQPSGIANDYAKQQGFPSAQAYLQNIRQRLMANQQKLMRSNLTGIGQQAYTAEKQQLMAELQKLQGAMEEQAKIPAQQWNKPELYTNQRGESEYAPASAGAHYTQGFTPPEGEDDGKDPMQASGYSRDPDKFYPGAQPAHITKGQEAIEKEYAHAGESLIERGKARERLNSIAHALELYQTGRQAEAKSEIVAHADAWGVGGLLSGRFKGDHDPADMEFILKNATGQVFDSLSHLKGKVLEKEYAGAQKMANDPNMTPEGNKRLLAQALGFADYDDKYDQDYINWYGKNKGADLDSEFDKRWSAANKSDDMVHKRYLELGVKGAPVPEAKDRPEGFTAIGVNKKTGKTEKRVWQGGQWILAH